MPAPTSRLPTTADALLRRIGLRRAPGLGLALAAVLTTHLWVIDAWSLPSVDADVVRPAPRAVTTLPASARLSAPAHLPAPAAIADSPVPLLLAHQQQQRQQQQQTRPQAQTQPRRPAPPRPSPPAAAFAVPVVAMVDAVGALASDRAEPARATDGESENAEPEHRLLALAAVGGHRAALSAAASNTLTAPPSVRLLYRMKKGPLAGTGQIDWQRDAGAYRMRLEARVPIFGQIFMETSEGRLDASGLAPLRHTERRIKRSERALSFVRDQGVPRILFSAREGEEPLRPGAQDRLSWIAQLATRMATPPAGDWRPGSSLEMDVASTGGDVQRWVFTVQGQDSAGLWQLRREPDSPHDTRAEVWIDPRQHHWPVRIRLSEPSGDPLELNLDGMQPV